MQSCYVIKLDPLSVVIADLVKPGKLAQSWTITRINVPPGEYRGKGYGSEILQRILADADANQVSLQLEPSPSGSLDYDALVAWYERYGFRMQKNGYMVRRPRKL